LLSCSDLLLSVCLQIFGCVLCAVGSYALNNKVAALAGQTLPQGTQPRAHMDEEETQCDDEPSRRV